MTNWIVSWVVLFFFAILIPCQLFITTIVQLFTVLQNETTSTSHSTRPLTPPERLPRNSPDRHNNVCGHRLSLSYPLLPLYSSSLLSNRTTILTNKPQLLQQKCPRPTQCPHTCASRSTPRGARPTTARTRCPRTHPRRSHSRRSTRPFTAPPPTSRSGLCRHLLLRRPRQKHPWTASEVTGGTSRGLYSFLFLCSLVLSFVQYPASSAFFLLFI